MRLVIRMHATSPYPTTRWTTREAAEQLSCTAAHAVALLRAAGVPCSRHGSGYLWDAAGVERLTAALEPIVANDNKQRPAEK